MHFFSRRESSIYLPAHFHIGYIDEWEEHILYLNVGKWLNTATVFSGLIPAGIIFLFFENARVLLEWGDYWWILKY